MQRPPPRSKLFPYTTLFRSKKQAADSSHQPLKCGLRGLSSFKARLGASPNLALKLLNPLKPRSEEHTSELHHSQISYAVFCLKKKTFSNWLHVSKAIGATDS